MGTGTEVAVEVMHGNHPLLANDPLQRQLYANMLTVGGVAYTPEEQAFATALAESFGDDDAFARLGDSARVGPYRPRQTYGSTDVGDVSWVAPTGGVRAATWAPGPAAHSWQAAAASGMSAAA